jgi:DNA-binding NarL/FixJ family response regulator
MNASDLKISLVERIIESPFRNYDLTERELWIVNGVASGKDVDEIASRLGISKRMAYYNLSDALIKISNQKGKVITIGDLTGLILDQIKEAIR